MPAKDRLLDPIAAILKRHDTSFRVDHFDGNLQHDPALRGNRQNRRIGFAPLLAEGRQHHLHDGIPALEDEPQCRVEPAGCVAIGRRQKLVVEAEAVEEIAQYRIVVMGEALVGTEGIGDARQRLAEMLGEHCLVGNVVGHLAQAVHVV